MDLRLLCRSRFAVRPRNLYRLRRFWNEALTELLPALCLLCSKPAGNGAWCGQHALPEPGLVERCAVCSTRLPRFHANPERCSACVGTRKALRFSRAAYDYRQQAAARDWILALKHGGRVDLAEPLGAVLAEELERSGWEAEALVPVPLHPWRLFERGYDQARALSRATSQALGRSGRTIPCHSALRRVRNTGPQGAEGPELRLSNVAGAFRVSPRWRDRVRGARLVLIDDVLTSGATLDECARALRRGGAREVRALVVATAR